MVNSLTKACSIFHTNEINQNSAVVPGNRSHAITTKYGRKVIVVLNSHLGGIVISYQNVEAAWSISVEREQKKPWVLCNSNIKTRQTRYSCHTYRF